MEIYFDDILINEDYYTALSTNFFLFSDTFYLGSTASNTYNISIAKEVVTNHPKTVLVKNEGVLIATLVVDKVEENDFEYKYTLIDKMVNLEFNYDASEIFNNGGATLLEITQDICKRAGIELATMDFRGYTKWINWYDNTRTAREYIGYIAELNGGYAQIGKDGKLYFIKQNTSPIRTISIDDCSDFKIGEKHTITRVVYEQGAVKYEYGDETGNTLYLSGDNVYITEQIEVEEIFNEINGFEFYSFSTSNCPIDYNIMAGEIVTFTDGRNNYPTIVGYELTYNGDWYGGYNFDVATKKQEETQVTGTSERIRNLTIKVDRESNKITQAIKEIDNQNSKINTIEQTVYSLRSQISEVADVTISADGYGSVSLANINESEPIRIELRPVGDDIAYLYPRDNLYPSEDLFLKDRTIRFITTDYAVDWELPDDLLYYDADNYDELILDYEAQSCVINKKVAYNTDGSKYLLDTPQTITYTYPIIPLQEGDYAVTVLGYENAYLFVRLMVQNIYTTQFATKAEMNSSVTQTKEEISSEVNAKFTNYSTTKEMNSAINQKANEITSTVSSSYATKDELNTTKTEIKQTTDSISSTVAKKVGKNEVISEINQSSEAVGIKAEKIELSANDILNLLAGNTINMSGKNIKISSDNFNVDANGNMQCNNAILNNVTINSGNISMEGNGSTPTIEIKENDGDALGMYASNFWMTYNYFGEIVSQYLQKGGYYVENETTGQSTTVWYDGITTPVLTQTSLESQKKNFEKLEKALDIIKQVDIYKYNLKSEKDTDKKHIGFVIGDNYKYSKELTSNNNDGADIYSLASCCLAGIKEQQEIIEHLQEEISKLKEEK